MKIRSDTGIFRGITKKKPRATSQTVYASFSMLNAKVYDSIISKRLNK